MKPLILIGGGGHAKVLASIARLRGRTLIGFTDVDAGRSDLGIPRLGTDDTIRGYSSTDILLVNGLGSICASPSRSRIFESFTALGYRFETLVHPLAIVAPEAELASGVQIMAGAIVQPGVRIGANSIVNTGSSIDHDSRVGDHVHIAPGVVICGDVWIGDGAHIGAGTCIVQGIRIGASVTVGAGALVRKDLPPGVTAYGSPAEIAARSNPCDS